MHIYICNTCTLTLKLNDPYFGRFDLTHKNEGSTPNKKGVSWVQPVVIVVALEWHIRKQFMLTFHPFCLHPSQKKTKVRCLENHPLRRHGRFLPRPKEKG